MAYEIVGTPGYLGGASGTAQVPQGAVVLSVVAHASSAATMVMFSGVSVAINSGQTLQLYFNHRLWQSKGSPGPLNQIVFTGTDSYWVEYFVPFG